MPLQMGVVGAGNMARGHIRRLLAASDVEIAGLADSSEESIAAARAAEDGLNGVPAYPSMRALLDGRPLNAVLIATPHTIHYEQIVAALDAGLHVLCEKPLVHTAALAREVAQRANAADRTVVVAFQRRFAPAYRYLRRLVQAGKLGELRHAAAMQTQAWLKMTEGTWRRTVSLGGGGQLSDSGSHLFDALLWSSGRRVVEVDARTRHYGSEVEIDGAAVLLFDNGAVGTVSIVGSGHTYWERLLLVGSDAAVRVDHSSGGGFRLIEEDAGTNTARTPAELPAGSDPVTHFLQVVRGEATNESPPGDTVHLLEVVEAIRQAGRTGARVAIPAR